MSKPYDAAGKDLIEATPAAWLAVAGTVRPPEKVWLIDADLSATVTTATDKVIYVDDPEPWLILAELHTYSDADLPYDLMRRHALLVHRHRKPVSCLVVLLRPEANASGMTGAIPQRNPLGKDWDFPFEVVRLWTEDPDKFLNGPLNLLPFAPLTRIAPGDTPRVKERIRERFELEASRAERDRLAAGLFTLLALRYDKRGIEFWSDLMTSLDISKTYLAEKIRTEGRTEGLRESILLLGASRFGVAPAAAVAALDQVADLDRLRAILGRINAAASWDDLLGPTTV